MDILYKDPDERSDFHIEWQAALQDGDYVISSTWIVPVGLASSAPSIHVANELDLAGRPRQVQRTTVFLEGGESGKIYTVTNRIATARGRQLDRSFELRMEDH